MRSGPLVSPTIESRLPVPSSDYGSEATMRAAFYTEQGPAREVLRVGEQPTPEPGPGVVLVSGGAGAVGHYAIQLARMRGARVLATVSGDAKASHARAAGAESVINYRTEDVGARIRELTDGRGVDAVIEVDLTANAKLLPAI